METTIRKAAARSPGACPRLCDRPQLELSVPDFSWTPRRLDYQIANNIVRMTYRRSAHYSWISVSSGTLIALLGLPCAFKGHSRGPLDPCFCALARPPVVEYL